MLGTMTSIADAAVQILRQSGLYLGPGYTAKQLAAIEARYGFGFNRDHAAVLRQVTPEGWTDWLGDEQHVRKMLSWPVEGLLFDVEVNGVWFSEWGERPKATSQALELVRQRLARVPRLVPIYRHRYIPAAPEPTGAPVLSVYQTDIIYYGTDLADYCAHEFLGRAGGRDPVRRVPFWSDFL